MIYPGRIWKNRNSSFFDSHLRFLSLSGLQLKLNSKINNNPNNIKLTSQMEKNAGKSVHDQKVKNVFKI